MGKLLLWAIVVLAALIAMRLWTHKNARHNARSQRRNANQPSHGTTPPESMVRCAYCGIHLPRSDALLQHGQLWCCAEHARLGLASGVGVNVGSSTKRTDQRT